jgi:predicted DNA-binding protein with PD1-like motif
MFFWIGLLGVCSLMAFYRLRERADSASRVYALRLSPGADLKMSLLAFAREHGLRAASIVTCVGSLQRAHLRFADQEKGTVLEGKYEIVSLVGAFSADAGGHFHLSIADGQGHTIGGHLLDGNLVYTTAEITLLEATDLEFRREPDSLTGYRELRIYRR